jgi:hypothetical protein
MRWKPDEIDVWCGQWASQRRKMLGIDQIEPKDRLGKLNSTLGAVREERDGASQGVVSQNFPEVYTGITLEVHRAFHAMNREWRQVIQLQYVWREIPVKVKAASIDCSIRDYWHRLNFGKAFIQGFVTMNTQEDRERVRTQNTLAITR